MEEFDSGLATCSDLPSCSEVPSCSEIPSCSAGEVVLICPVVAAAAANASASNIKKRLLQSSSTLKQHYYPETGWGWFVVSIGFVVQILNHGLHLSFGVLLPAILRKFHTSTDQTAGMTCEF